MNTYDEAKEELDSCANATDLAKFARELYASGLLDEAEQLFDHRGPLAPWSYPEGSEEIWSNGEDVIIRLPSGVLAQFSNQVRAWLDVDEEDTRINQGKE